jgi:hypothetical protein
VIDPKHVSAVIVTRGDVDLEPILATLPYDEVIVWDNSRKDWDARTYGRYLALQQVSNEVVYCQDDDLIFTCHDELLAAFTPGHIAVNMPSPWFEECGYDQAECWLPSGGSVMERDLPWPALDRYLEHWPRDEFFLGYCDFVFGMLTPGLRLDLGFDIRPEASNSGRISTVPGSDARKMEIMRRAAELRVGVAA